MHPIFDPSSLSDDDLITKIGQARMFMNAQIDLGHTPTVDSIKTILEALELERVTRFQSQISEEQKKKSTKATDAITLGELDMTPRPVFEDEGERKRAAKIRRRRT